MNRRLRRKPVVLSIESLEERQLLRHSAVLPADLDSWLQDVVVQWRTERAKLREERLALRADHSQHAPHQPLLAKAPHGRHGHRTREHRGTGPLGGQTTAAPVPGGTTTTITTAPPASTGVTTGSRPPGAHPNTSGPTISIQPGSTFGQEGGGITTTTPIATFQLLNGQANASDFTATIQWNDGSGGTSNGNVQTDPYNGGFDVFPPSHTFSEEGTYEPTVTVNYDGGASASTTATASIQDAMLTGTSVAISATSGKSFSGTVATFTDGNPNPSQGDFSATIDWGDNSTTSGSIGTTMVSGQTVFTVTGNHTYSIQSQYAIENVRVTINDKGGANTQVTSMATVVSPPLAVTGGGTYTAYVNQNFSNTLATFSGGVASGGYSAQINWGDGGTSNGSIAGSQVKGNHTYQSVGTYTVTITVTNNGINASATDTVKVKNPPPQVAPNLCSKPGLAQQDACPTGGNPGALAMSISGIDTATGAVLSADPLDLESDGFGMTWGQGLGWSNVPGAANGSNNGNGMVNAFLPSLNQFPNSAYASAYIEMVDSPYNNVPFTTDQYGRPLYFGNAGIQQQQGNTGDIIIHDAAGDVFDFTGFGSGIPAAQQGQFKSFTDPYGNVTQVTNHTADGQIAEVQRTGPVPGGTVTESLIYTYIANGVNAGLISNVTLRRDYSPGTAGTSGIVRQVSYTYYDGTPQAYDANGNPEFFGNAGDLELATVEDANRNPLDNTYYRYYTPTDIANGAPGYVDGLKYFFQTDSYARMSADPNVGNPLTAPDSAVKGYADAYYEYDSNQRVTKTVTQGTACSCTGSTGQGTFTYQYLTNTNPSSDPSNPNDWQNETIETLPDGNQNYIFTNYAGEVIFNGFYDQSDAGNSLLNHTVTGTDYRYDTSGRLIMTAQPSAVTIRDLTTLTNAAAANPDIVGYNQANNTYQYLSANSGVIDVTDYWTSPTTATATAPGNVEGYVTDDKVENGYADPAPTLLNSTQYISHTIDNGADNVYEVAASTVYRNSDGTGAETTTTAYTWYPNTNQIEAMAVTQPTIGTGQNGPNTTDTTTTYYDTYGRPVWVQDPDGHINYAAYDNATGAVTMTIQDVDAREAALYGTPPAGLSIPASGHLDLVTTDTVDALGRTVKEVDPNNNAAGTTDNATYTVYDDPDHEVFVYPGWNATTHSTTGPTEVYRHDQALSYSEVLTTSLQPSYTGSVGTYVPSGEVSPTASDIQSLSRTIYDNSDRPIEVDNYVTLNGVAYSQTAQRLGSASTNTGTSQYDATLYGYDDMGRLDHVVSPNGTITDTYYDSLGDPISTYVGTTTSTTPSEEWSSSHTGMTLVSQNVYDGTGPGGSGPGGVGDGNLTQTTLFADGNSADNRVTQYAYDWRDRLVATKSGADSNASGEDTYTGRPIYYYDLDNLGEVTGISRYDGDGVALTNTKPSASLLRAYTTIAYDDQGRPYQVQQYSVDPLSGNKGGTLTTNYYYDYRGDLVGESDPGGLWTKDQYDGAGRLVTESLTDGAGDTGGVVWNPDDSLSIASDHVLTQTLTTYDADGNPTLVTTKDRFDSDSSLANTDVGPLGNATTGPLARVSYTAYYYDQADRLITSVDVGTNGSAAYTRPASPPAPSDTALVTSYAYDVPGLPAGNGLSPYLTSTTDPRGIATQDTNDLLGEVTQTIDGYQQTVSQTTQYAYDANGDVSTVTALNANGAPSQVTQYVYGVTTASGTAIGQGSETNSNDLLAGIEYPDPTTGAPSTNAANQEIYTYNQLGDTYTATDPNGTKHQYAYDVLGRQVSDTVKTLGAGVDGSVMELDTAYDSAGNPYKFTSKDVNGNLLNQVEDLYNGFGQLITEYQNHGDSSSTTTAPAVQYTYNDPSTGGNNSRPTSMVYPNGRVLNYVYDSTGTGQSALDSSISRISALQDGTGSPTPGQTLEAYTYLGLDTIVERNYEQPGVKLSYIQQSGETHLNQSGGDKYTGLDQFGRVVDQNWVNNSAPQSSVVREQYGYDRNGDVLYRNNLVDSALSQLYQANGAASNSAYDPLGRLTSFEQGTLPTSGPLNTINSPTSSQSWQLDALGNWTSVTTNGTTTNRLFNAQNQTINATSLPEPGYDRNGNTTSDNGQIFVYDAWDRVVKVLDGTQGDAPVAQYTYDALSRRIEEAHGSTTNHLYYNSAGQVIEERQNGTAASNLSQQYVWSLAYVNAMVLRDTFSGGTFTQRLYALQDANFDTVALVSTSGAVVEQYSYTPYGTVTVLDANGNPVSGNQSAYGWRYLFQGGRADSATGWYEFGVRDYIPAEGRWAERDPWGLGAGDPNVYRFVGNDPANATDPFGFDRYWGQTIWDGVTGAAQKVWDTLTFIPQAATKSDVNSAYTNQRFGANFNNDPLAAFDNSSGVPASSRMSFPNGDPSSPGINNGMMGAAEFAVSMYGEAFSLVQPTGMATIRAEMAAESRVGAPIRPGGTGTPPSSSCPPANSTQGPLFGQRRVDPRFGIKGRPDYLAGRSIQDVAADLRAGRLSPDQLPIDAFRLPDGRLVSANTRSLAALSEAGLRPTIIREIRPTFVLKNRLRERPIIPNAPLPGPRVPVTPSQCNDKVLRVIELPR